MKKTSSTSLLLSEMLLAILGTFPLAAQQEAVSAGAISREGRGWVQVYLCRIPTQPGRTLRVHADLGNLSVVPAGPGEVTCRVHARVFERDREQAQRRFERLQITAGPAEDGVQIVGRVRPQDRRSYASLNLRFELAVPRRYNLQLETRAGEIDIGALDGTVEAVTAAGNIVLQNVTGETRVRTAGGNIRLGELGAGLVAHTAGGFIQVMDVKGDADLRTNGGAILGGRIDGQVQAQTAGGDILLQAAGGPVHARTAGGQIHIGETGDAVEAQTDGGSIRVFGGRGPVQVRTAGGSIDLLDLQGAVQARTGAGRIQALIASTQLSLGASQLETAVGDVRVYLPADLRVTIQAVIDNAQGYRIRSDFPLVIEGTGGVPAGTVRGRGALNGGGEVLRIHTANGNIEILRLTQAVNEQLRRQREEMHREILREIQRRMEHWQQKQNQQNRQNEEE